MLLNLTLKPPWNVYDVKLIDDYVLRILNLETKTSSPLVDPALYGKSFFKNIYIFKGKQLNNWAEFKDS